MSSRSCCRLVAPGAAREHWGWKLGSPGIAVGLEPSQGAAQGSGLSHQGTCFSLEESQWPEII